MAQKCCNHLYEKYDSKGKIPGGGQQLCQWMGCCAGNDKSAGKQLVSLALFLKVFASHNIHVLYIMPVFVSLTSSPGFHWPENFP